MRGHAGNLIRLALEYGAAHHPEIVQRQDVLLLGIYRLLRALHRRLCPAEPPFADYDDLTGFYLEDLMGAYELDEEAREARAAARSKTAI